MSYKYGAIDISLAEAGAGSRGKWCLRSRMFKNLDSTLFVLGLYRQAASR